MKKLSDPVRKVNSQSVGLDVHKAVTVYCVLDSSGKTAREGRFASRGRELESFIRRVLEDGDTHITFEASRSSLWVYEVVSGVVGEDRTHVANAKEIRAIANSKKKNDSNDAWWLAYLTSEGRLPSAYVPEGEILELRIATRERSAAVQRRTKVSREGSPHLRWALTQGAMGCLRARSGAGFAAGNWIRAKQKRMGIKAKARAAGGRKLAEAIWRLFHYGECFDPARPFGGKKKTA